MILSLHTFVLCVYVRAYAGGFLYIATVLFVSVESLITKEGGGDDEFCFDE